MVPVSEPQLGNPCGSDYLCPHVARGKKICNNPQQSLDIGYGQAEQKRQMEDAKRKETEEFRRKLKEARRRKRNTKKPKTSTVAENSEEL